MECEEVKKEYDLVNTRCCESCHEDSDMGHGEDLWFEDPQGIDRNICCSLAKALDEL